MAFYHRNSERKRIAQDYRRQEEEVVGSLCRLGSRPVSPKSLLEQEKRIRREIANSNERRRMQSINAGFQSLRALLPHRDGEKLSKAAILQNTADYVYKLEQERARLVEQNSQLTRRMLDYLNHGLVGSCFQSHLLKHKREPADCVDEGIGSSSPSMCESEVDEVRREISHMRLQLEQERALRLLLEEQVKNFEFEKPFEKRCDLIEKLRQACGNGNEDDFNSTINMGHESGIESPQSPNSCQDLESPHEISLRESTPELSGPEIPEDLSGKNNSLLLQCVNGLSMPDMTAIPELLMSPNHLDVSPSFQCKQVSTSRQNLETIVEAIRHVEGEHMFQDDTAESEETRSIKEEKLSFTDQYSEQIDHSLLFRSREFSFQHQIIRNAPLTQARPGVIVSNLS